MPLAERISKSNEVGHHVQLLRLYLKREGEYRLACSDSIGSELDFRQALHRFKSALSYVASENIVKKLTEIENLADQGLDVRKEELEAFFLDLDDLLESVKAYISEHGE